VRDVAVLRKAAITPRMTRVFVGGPALEGFSSPGPDDHAKLFFPRPGETVANASDRRDYTPRLHDAVAGELAFDFVLHGDGPATTWARDCEAGARVGVAGPRGTIAVAPDFDWQLLVGDATALPAIGRRIEEAAAGTRIHAVVEVEDEGDEQRFETRADLAITYVHRRGAAEGPLEAAVRQATFRPGEYFAWVAGESHDVRRIRDHLVDERGANHAWVHASGYWKRGHSD
jgi:NADPH-dependent ferric siderophore reductase